MFRNSIASFAFCLLLLAGCNDSSGPREPTPQPGGKVEVVAPGVNIQVQKDGKVDVNAPGVNVQKR